MATGFPGNVHSTPYRKAALRTAAGPVAEMAVPSLRDHADELLADSLALTSIITSLRRQTTDCARRFPQQNPGCRSIHFETHCGIVVSGVAVTESVASVARSNS